MVSKGQLRLSRLLDEAAARHRGIRPIKMPGLLACLTALQEYSHEELPVKGEMWIHWYYVPRRVDALSRCEIFHLNMLRRFHFDDRVRVIHIRCAYAGPKTAAMEQAEQLLSAGKAEVDFRVDPPKPSWEHDTFKECVEYANETGEFVYYTHFKYASRLSEPSLGLRGSRAGFGAELDNYYWSYLMYLGLASAPASAKAIGPLLHTGTSRSFKNRDTSWSRLGEGFFHYCGSFQAFSGTYLQECFAALGLADRARRDTVLWFGGTHTVEQFLSAVSLKADVWSLPEAELWMGSSPYSWFSQKAFPAYWGQFVGLAAHCGEGLPLSRPGPGPRQRAAARGLLGWPL